MVYVHSQFIPILKYKDNPLNYINTTFTVIKNSCNLMGGKVIENYMHYDIKFTKKGSFTKSLCEIFVARNNISKYFNREGYGYLMYCWFKLLVL